MSRHQLQHFVHSIYTYVSKHKKETQKRSHKTTTQWDNDDQFHSWVIHAIKCHFSTVCTSALNKSFIFIHMIVYLCSKLLLLLSMTHDVCANFRPIKCDYCTSTYSYFGPLRNQFLSNMPLSPWRSYFNAKHHFKSRTSNHTWTPHLNLLALGDQISRCVQNHTHTPCVTHITHANKFVLNFKTNKS